MKWINTETIEVAINLFFKDNILDNLDDQKLEDVWDTFNTFIEKEINSITLIIKNNLVIEGERINKIESILNNIGDMKNIYEENLSLHHTEFMIHKYERENGISRIENIKKYIQNILTNLSKIKNKRNQLIVNIPKSWKITETHSENIKEMIIYNKNYLEKYIKLSSELSIYNQLFSNILDKLIY